MTQIYIWAGRNKPLNQGVPGTCDWHGGGGAAAFEVRTFAELYGAHLIPGACLRLLFADAQQVDRGDIV